MGKVKKKNKEEESYFTCYSCKKKISSYDDIKVKIIDINGYDYMQETCPHCNGDIRG